MTSSCVALVSLRWKKTPGGGEGGGGEGGGGEGGGGTGGGEGGGEGGGGEGGGCGGGCGGVMGGRRCMESLLGRRQTCGLHATTRLLGPQLLVHVKRKRQTESAAYVAWWWLTT
jgi:hypothetical protein